MKKYQCKNNPRSYRELMDRYEQVQLTGKQLYDRYGVKRNEVLFGDVASFSNGYTLEVEMVVGEEDEYPECHVRLYSKDGTVLADVSEDYDKDSLLGLFTVEDEETDSVYAINITMQHCAVPIRHMESDESVTIAYCDSEWLVKRFDFHKENLLRFLHEHTPDEAASLLNDAVLARAVAFFYNEEEDEPFNFCDNEDWKYQAFADVISGWLNKNHVEAAKALDCFLNL